ncbi:MAG: DUF421 domain-containing protein [Clostridia bacterium]|nr:DUF421 domain-containing protein [Clostridia bacterium]
MAILFVRTTVLYFVLIVGMRLMGKRQIGELSISELVVATMVSDLATVALQDRDNPLLGAVVSVMALIFFELLLSLLCAKIPFFHRALLGNPMVLVKNGRIQPQSLQKLRMTRQDVLEELRLAGVENPNRVKLATVETNGKVSVIQKEEKP